MTPTSRPSLAVRIFAPFVSRDLERRDLALDAFRGLMILGMILVNHPPPTTAIYPLLVHAAWNGWTLADTIFPGFLFAVGMSIRLSMAGVDAPRGAGEALPVGKVLWRFALLMLLNVLLINFPYYFGGTLQFSGTLALIAWCYLFAAFFFRKASPRRLALAIGLLLAVQWAALAWVPLPGAERGTMTPDSNVARYLDSLVFAPLLGASWSGAGSEVVVLTGLGLAFLGALASTLIGVTAAHVMSEDRPVVDRFGRLFAIGLALTVLGAAWGFVLPVNKSLWTGSYVLLMGGFALQTFALGSWLVNRCGLRAWALLLQVAGANALLIYVLAQAIQRVLVYGRLPSGDGAVTRLRQLIHDALVSSGLGNEFGSFLYAMTFVVACYAVAWVLYRRRLFIRL